MEDRQSQNNECIQRTLVEQSSEDVGQVCGRYALIKVDKLSLPICLKNKVYEHCAAASR